MIFSMNQHEAVRELGLCRNYHEKGMTDFAIKTGDFLSVLHEWMPDNRNQVLFMAHSPMSVLEAQRGPGCFDWDRLFSRMLDSNVARIKEVVKLTITTGERAYRIYGNWGIYGLHYINFRSSPNDIAWNEGLIYVGNYSPYDTADYRRDAPIKNDKAFQIAGADEAKLDEVATKVMEVAVNSLKSDDLITFKTAVEIINRIWDLCE